MKFYWIISNIRKFKREIHRVFEAAAGEEKVREVFMGHTKRERLYHTWPLFQVFLNQVASGMSCSEAIAWGIAHRLLPPATSPKTSAYCNAKGRLAEAPIAELMKSAGAGVEEQAHKGHRIFGRDIKVVDSTSIQLPDTESNQAVYPQPDGQAPGCGQPLMKVCALMGLGSGAILDCEIGAYRTHERVLFRTLWRSLLAGDIVLGDRGFGSYAEAASLLGMDVDFVFRQRQAALKNKRLEKIGDGDWLVEWKRPKEPVDWVSRDELPARITIRAIRFNTGVKGFRSGEIILFTSLVDRKKYPKEKLIELYYRRWEMELRFRDVKTTMGMELLKSKTPSGCRKELWMGLLAYNIVRGVMLDASLRGRLPVSRISFKGTIGRLDAFSSGHFATADPLRAYLLLLDHLIDARVPDRPGRIEPRKRKRRPKQNYSLLTVPRKTARIEALSA